MKTNKGEEWDIEQWKKAMDARGSPEEEEAYVRLGKYLMSVSHKLFFSKFDISCYLQRNPSISLDELAQDFVQQTLMKVYENYTRFQWRSQVKTWATTILINEIIRELRKKDISVILFDNFNGEINNNDNETTSYILEFCISQSISTVESIVEEKEELEILEISLEQLTDLQRQVMVKVYIEEKPIPIVSKELGITIDALYKNLSRARKSIRLHLQAQGIYT